MNIKTRIVSTSLYRMYRFICRNKGNQAIVLRSLLGIYSKEE